MRIDEGSGSDYSSIVKNIASAGTNAAKKQRAKSSRTRRAVQGVYRAGANAANRASRSSSSRSSRSSRSQGASHRSQGGTNNYGQNYRAQNSYRPATGSTSSGVVTPTVPKPVIPKFDQAYLQGDTAYSSQRNAFNKALADYASQQKADWGNYNTEYNASLDKLGKDQTLNAQALKDDYASRGLLESGVYANALNDFNADYDSQRADLNRARTAYQTDQTTAQGNFKTEQQLLLDKAYQDALNRYNDKYKG